MAVTAMWMNVDERLLVTALEEAKKKLDGAGGEAVLDFSSVRGVDASMLKALEEFVHTADEKAVKVVLRGVNIDVYRVLKLVKLTEKFSFVS